jgi:ABC-2 type transport system ATP-binding protein
MSPAIEVNNLHKAFSGRAAVAGASFFVEQGEIYSLLGPNGAGKTTTISILSTLLRPDSGEARIMGASVTEKPDAVRRALGVVPQEIALYEDLSARENLAFWGRMVGLGGAALKQRVDEALAVIELSGRADGRVGQFSGGMKRRVNIAAALLHHPSVIFMDEPTVGIDPQSRRAILDWVKRLKAEGMTVLYTTHYMEEAEELSDHIGIMDHGQVIAQGTLEELVRIVGQADRVRLTLSAPCESLADAWSAAPDVGHVAEEAGVFTILTSDAHAALPRLFEIAGRLGARVASVDIQRPDLEAVFLHLTGRGLRE